jgi:hypothetical protein
VIAPWFDVLNHILITYKIIPQLFFNCDETALFIKEPKTPKVVTHTDCPVLPLYATPERMPTATVLFTIAADSTHLPTVILWPRKVLPPELTIPQEDIVFMPSTSGWETKESFLSIVTTILIPAMLKKRDSLGDPSRSMLLLLDSHCSRCSSPLLRITRKNKIILYTIPPHTSHILQPCDRGPNATMKIVRPIQLALAAKFLAEFFLTELRKQLRKALQPSPPSASSSVPPPAFTLPFTPPPSPAHLPPVQRGAATPDDFLPPKPPSKVARQRATIAHALPHVFARALAEPVVQQAWLVSGLWPPDKTRICSQLPPVYVGPQPPPSTRNSMLPTIGGVIVNTPELLAKIEAWEDARGQRPHAVEPSPQPKIALPIVYDDDSSTGSDMDPIPLEELDMEEDDAMPPSASAMEQEPQSRYSASDTEGVDEHNALPAVEDEGPDAADVEFDNDDNALLE